MARASRVSSVGAAVAVVAAIAVYLPALANGFIWDDPLVLQQLRAIHTWHDLLVPPPPIPPIYYRPLIFATYLADRALGGEAPFWFHVSVVALHAVNCFLVFRLAAHVFGGDSVVPGAGALLFAVFPTHAESVDWMAGRSDVVVCTLLLLTVLLGVRREALWTAWLGGAVLFLALLAKETAISGVLLVPAVDWLGTRRLYWRRYVPLLIGSLAYFALRQHGVGAMVGGAPVTADPMSMAGDLLSALGFYVIQSVVPLHLSPYVPAVPHAALYLAVGAVTPLAGAALLYRAEGRARWQLAVWLVWFAATLLPSLTVLVRRSASAPVADRYLYVPSVASSLLIAWAIALAVRRRTAAVGWTAGIVAGLSIALGLRTAAYARVWADNLSFWSTVVAVAPPDALAERELASALRDRGRLPEAERALQAALALPSDPEGRVMTYGNLGVIYRREGRYADAIAAFESALRIAPHPALYNNLGIAFMAKAEEDQRQGESAAVLDDVRQARSALETALTFSDRPDGRAFLEDWDPAKTHALLGQVLNALGDHAGARDHLQTALRLEPSGPAAEATRRYLQHIPP